MESDDEGFDDDDVEDDDRAGGAAAAAAVVACGARAREDGMRSEIDRLLRENERLRRDRRDGGGDGDRRNDRFDDEAGDGGRSNALVPWGRSSDLVPQMHGARGSSKMSAGKTQEFLRREAAMKRTNEAIGSGLRSESGAL